MQDTNIGKRLKEFRGRSNVKMPSVSIMTGIAKETLYKWEKGTKPSDVKDYFKLKAYLDAAEGELEGELFDLERQKPATVKLPFKNCQPVTSQIDGKAIAGTVIINANNELELIANRIYAPNLGYVEGLIDVIGYDMEPALMNGSSIAISRLKDFQNLHWGLYYYIIDANLQGIVRRVYLDNANNGIQLIADNDDQVKYPPIQLKWTQVKSIFKIAACLIKQ
ncbi:MULTISPECIES: LexA family transcriptional regulator [Niastella]|uniref:LexA family transcriptional regulator n=1 Tax=Niastella soli TaxID=2821487 RepID=A0ABS3Z210_9BACT|nr:LexA family transcriptional regulator [Niastella soli]MBO9204194.1 LexA family transcriptional regulator [Niastella soli]